MAVDFHTHIQDMDIDLDLIKKSGITPFVNGYSHKANKKALLFYNTFKYPFFIGIAPQEAQKSSKDEIDVFLEYVEKNAMFGIGEIGMDFHWAGSEGERELQLYAFENQLEIAERKKLPVVLHTRKAEDFVVDYLIEHSFSQKVAFHFYSGKLNTALKAFNNLKAYFSIVPFPSKDRKKVILNTSLSNLLVETDSPYAGKTPLDVFKSIKYISRIKEVDESLVEKQTSLNAFDFIK